VAIVLLVRDRVREFRSTLWLDGLVGALAAAAIGAALVFGAIAGSGDGATTVAVDLAYALGDLVLLAFVVAVFALTGWRPGLALFLVGTGLAVSAIVDSFFLYESATGSIPGTTLVASLWPMGALLLGSAAWQRPAPATAMRLEGWRVFLMPSAFALSGLGLLAYDTFESVNPLALILAMATLGAVIVRMALTFRENVRLLNSSRKEAMTDALTGLGNRRKLMHDLELELALATDESPRGLLLFDLDGFKQYNDRYGHPLGDALLARLGRRLSAAVKSRGTAYRLGGDEFCVIGYGTPMEIMEVTEAAKVALSEQGEGFSVQSSCGVAMIPEDGSDIKVALHIADERLYAQKNGRQRFSVSRETGAALLQALEEREPDLRGHLDKVAQLSRSVAEKLGLSGQELDDVTRAAQLHDVGKVAVPDAVLQKAGPLDPMEWDFMHQHTIVGERILNAAPALTSVAKLVRSSHERYDGKGYPDGMAGNKIPLGARVISACDAFHAMTSTRPYGQSMTPDEALDELLRCANLQFDPRVVEALCEVVATEATMPRAAVTQTVSVRRELAVGADA
jgi:diguanylate cyclase (GGDEF)-like protein